MSRVILALAMLAVLAGTMGVRTGGAAATGPNGSGSDTLRVEIALDAPGDTLSLGRPFELGVTLTHPHLEGIRLTTAADRLEPVELDSWRRELDRGDTASVVLTLRPFRVGRVVLPPLRLEAETGDGTVCVGESDSLALFVASTVPDSVVSGALEELATPGMTPGEAVGSRLRDIHEALELSRPRAWWPWLLGAALLAAALAGVIWYRRRSSADLLESATARPADEMALEALDELSRSPLLPAGRWKRFYTELAGIIRTYLARRYGVDSPDLTTSETLRALRNLDLPGDAMAALREVLEDADRVKFARGAPASGQPEHNIERATGFVRQTRPAPASPESEGAAA